MRNGLSSGRSYSLTYGAALLTTTGEKLEGMGEPVADPVGTGDGLPVHARAKLALHQLTSSGGHVLGSVDWQHWLRNCNELLTNH